MGSFQPIGDFWDGVGFTQGRSPIDGHPLPAPMAEISGPMGPPVGTTLTASTKTQLTAPVKNS